MKKNVYQVGFGMLSDGKDYDANVGAYNVIAKDAKEAIAKVDPLLESGKDMGETWFEVFEGVKYVLTIDVE